MLKDGFRGIPLSFTCLGTSQVDDGRWLYEIETDTLEHQQVILEGLSAWGVHLISSLEKAKELAEKLNPGSVFEIDDGTTTGASLSQFINHL